MPLPSRRRSILFILPLQTKPAKLGNWAFPKTAPSANHDINELSGSGLLLGPAPLPNVIRLALSPCHDLAAMASFAPSMLQSSPSDTICISAVRVPRLAIPSSPCHRQLANQRRTSPLLPAFRFADRARHHPTLPNLTVATAIASVISLETSRAPRVIDTVGLPLLACFLGFARAIGSSVERA